MSEEDNFEDIRPYYDNEINQALKRIISNPSFDTILDFFFNDKDKDLIRVRLEETNSAHEFQLNFMHPLVYSIIGKTSKGLTSSGFDNLVPGKSYLFVGNHRDIVLDSAILQVLLCDYNHNTSEITFGSNLMINQFVVDLGKVNKMFKVVRGCNKKEFIRNSGILSAYIRHAITEKGSSVWIAQRSGRTKDGNDKTEPGLLKMFNMSSKKNFSDAYRELNIVPLSISYEYEPCCSFKIKELLETSVNGSYNKKPGEDLNSIITGITQPKGRIHMAACRLLNDWAFESDVHDTLNNKIVNLAQTIDSEIFSNYKLWPNNYIAFDLLNGNRKLSQYYTSEDEEVFFGYMASQTEGIEGDKSIIRDLFLKMYANPVINAGKVQQGI
jgi:hypothetical protein